MARIRLVQNDTPTLTFYLYDDTTGLPINLVGSTVSLAIRAVNTTTVLLSIPGTLLAGGVAMDGTIDTTITTPGIGGRVSFTFTTGQLNLPAGYYDAQVQYVNGSNISTVYETLQIEIRAAY